MQLKKYFSLSMLVAFLLISVLFQADAANITLAPSAEGTQVKTHYTYSNTSGTIQGGGSHIAPHGSSFLVQRTYSATNVGDGFLVTDIMNQGIVEFDIAPLAGSTVTSAQLKLTAQISGWLDPVKTLSLWDLSESSETGVLTTGKSRSAFLTDILSGPPYPGGLLTYTLDVTADIAAELLNIGTNHFAGFLIDWGTEPSSFPLYEQTPDASFSYGSELLVDYTPGTHPVPEPTTILLLGGSLVGIYLARKKIV